MSFLLVSDSRQLGRLGFTAALLLGLALTSTGVHAQHAARPTPGLKSAPAATLYYVDGQQVDKAALNQVAPEAMVQYINVLKPAQQQQIFHTSTAAPAVIVTTKAKANDPDVLAFNKRINDVVPLVPATPTQQAGVAAATAYVQQHYPAAKLESVGPMTGQDERYQATFLNQGQRISLLFDGQGRVVQ